MPSPDIPDTTSSEEWKRHFGAWMREVESRADRYPPGFIIDDSREAMYDGRGEGAIQTSGGEADENAS